MSGDQTAEALPDEAIAEPAPPAAARFARLKRMLGNRKTRIRMFGAAIPLTVMATLIALWMTEGLQEPEVSLPPGLTPKMLFGHACEVVREEQLKTLHVVDCAIDDELVEQISDLDWVETIIFDEGVVTDQGLQTIVQLPELKHLRLRLSPITDDGLKMIANMQSLWYLNLPHAECTSAGVAELQKIVGLRQLRIGSKHLSNDVTEQIAKMNGLRGVHLIGVPITDDGLETLAEMPHLESLYLDDCAVTEAGWDRLFRDHPHLHVHINQRHHDRDPKGHVHHD